MTPLESLAAEIRACRLCAGKIPAPRPVLRVSDTARILIVGQAPGTRVHASGTPFTDPSGVRLRRWMGVSEAVFYDAARIAIAPMGFCFPGQTADGADRPPRPECAHTWRARLTAALPPMDLTLLLGGAAMRWYLGDANVAAAVANWRAHAPARVPLPHPSWRNNAWLKKNPWFEAEVVPYVQDRVRAALDHP